jgi:hypothetical protein
VGFVVDKVALGQVFSEYFGFPCQSSFHQLLHSHPHLSSGACTIGQKWPQYPVDLVPTQEEKKSGANNVNFHVNFMLEQIEEKRYIFYNRLFSALRALEQDKKFVSLAITTSSRSGMDFLIGVWFRLGTITFYCLLIHFSVISTGKIFEHI